MVNSLIIGIVGIITLMVVWVTIQSLWRRSFSSYISDEDVLKGRSSCSNCGCTTACQKNGRQNPQYALDLSDES